MSKPTVLQRRARKRGAAKADYYPKVDLSEDNGVDVLAQIEALSPAEVDGPLAIAEALDAEAPVEMEALAEAQVPTPDPITPAAEVAAADDAILLPEFLDLAAATPLAKTLLERRGQPIVIDGTAVNQLGAQCVQVLLSAKKTWSADGVPLSFVNCAPRMIEDLQHLGINSAALISGEFAQ